MHIKSNIYVFHPASVFAFALFCAGCMASSLDLDAKAQAQSPLPFNRRLGRRCALCIPPGCTYQWIMLLGH